MSNENFESISSKKVNLALMNLKKLKINFEFHSRFKKDMIFLFCGFSKSLRELDVSENDYDDIKSMKQLVMKPETNTWITDDLLRLLKNLEVLNITGAVNISNKGIEDLLELKKLNISRTKLITNTSLSNLSKIKVLIMNDCFNKDLTSDIFPK